MVYIGLGKIGFPFSALVEKEFLSTLLIHLCWLFVDPWWHKLWYPGWKHPELTVEQYISQEAHPSQLSSTAVKCEISGISPEIYTVRLNQQSSLVGAWRRRTSVVLLNSAILCILSLSLDSKVLTKQTQTTNKHRKNPLCDILVGPVLSGFPAFVGSWSSPVQWAVCICTYVCEVHIGVCCKCCACVVDSSRILRVGHIFTEFWSPAFIVPPVCFIVFSQKPDSGSTPFFVVVVVVNEETEAQKARNFHW